MIRKVGNPQRREGWPGTGDGVSGGDGTLVHRTELCMSDGGAAEDDGKYTSYKKQSISAEHAVCHPTVSLLLSLLFRVAHWAAEHSFALPLCLSTKGAPGAGTGQKLAKRDDRRIRACDTTLCRVATVLCNTLPSSTTGIEAPSPLYNKLLSCSGLSAPVIGQHRMLPRCPVSRGRQDAFAYVTSAQHAVSCKWGHTKLLSVGAYWQRRAGSPAREAREAEGSSST